MNRFFAFACAAFIALMPFAAQAQTIDYQTIIAQGSTQAISFGSAFEQNHSRELALHFTLDVPTNEGQIRLQSNYNQPDRYGSIRFLTAEGRVAEVVDIFSGTIGAGPHADREAWLADLLKTEIIPNLGTFDQLNVLGARRATVGPYAAIEAIALYEIEGTGTVALRVVGVFPPAGENILIFVSHSVHSVLPFQDVTALSGTFAGTTLSTLHITATRSPDGTLKGF